MGGAWELTAGCRPVFALQDQRARRLAVPVQALNALQQRRRLLVVKELSGFLALVA